MTEKNNMQTQIDSNTRRMCYILFKIASWHYISMENEEEETEFFFLFFKIYYIHLHGNVIEISKYTVNVELSLTHTIKTLFLATTYT